MRGVVRLRRELRLEDNHLTPIVDHRQSREEYSQIGKPAVVR